MASQSSPLAPCPLSSFPHHGFLHIQVEKLRAENQHLAQDLLEAIAVPRTRLPSWELQASVKRALLSSPTPAIPSPLGCQHRTSAFRQSPAERLLRDAGNQAPAA